MSAIFSLDQITCKEDLRVGMSVFAVSSNSNYIWEFIVLSEPYLSNITKSFFIDVKYFNQYAKGFITTKISLDDHGIIPNTYNNIRSFYTRESAEAFVDNRKALGRIF